MAKREYSDLDKDSLIMHRTGRPGKVEVVATKPLTTQRDLALAYSPGVAAPCLEISDDPANAYEYTAKGNMVAVISNGTAVLGHGNLGALAFKPVMEGKAVLFKRFADVNSIDIEMDTEDLSHERNLVDGRDAGNPDYPYINAFIRLLTRKHKDPYGRNNNKGEVAEEDATHITECIYRRGQPLKRCKIAKPDTTTPDDIRSFIEETGVGIYKEDKVRDLNHTLSILAKAVTVALQDLDYRIWIYFEGKNYKPESITDRYTIWD